MEYWEPPWPIKNRGGFSKTRFQKKLGQYRGLLHCRFSLSPLSTWPGEGRVKIYIVKVLNFIQSGVTFWTCPTAFGYALYRPQGGTWGYRPNSFFKKCFWETPFSKTFGHVWHFGLSISIKQTTNNFHQFSGFTCFVLRFLVFNATAASLELWDKSKIKKLASLKATLVWNCDRITRSVSQSLTQKCEMYSY